MKNEDLSFKLLAVIIVAGLIAACLPSAHAAPEKQRACSSIFSTGGGETGTMTGFNSPNALTGPDGKTTE